MHMMTKHIAIISVLYCFFASAIVWAGPSGIKFEVVPTLHLGSSFDVTNTIYGEEIIPPSGLPSSINASASVKLQFKFADFIVIGGRVGYGMIADLNSISPLIHLAGTLGIKLGENIWLGIEAPASPAITLDVGNHEFVISYVYIPGHWWYDVSGPRSIHTPDTITVMFGYGFKFPPHR